MRPAMIAGENAYQSFLSSPSKRQWRRIGVQRRSGVATALFSHYSAQSAGIGEFPDIKGLADWCQKTSMSILQLLPLNDVGFKFTPYDSQSSFALEPMYLSLENLAGVNGKKYASAVKKLRAKFPTGKPAVDYGIKGAKLALLWEMFQAARNDGTGLAEYEDQNKNWLNDYALFKTLKEHFQERGWEDWEEGFKCRDPQALKGFEKEHEESVRFHKWLQWQLAEQLRAAKRYAESKGVLIMGDLPFLVSRDSADVWAHQDYFKLELAAGAPPDDYIAKGQRWGMPPYRWENIARHGYDYLIGKLKYAENFYDLFRIDHFVGIFRVWTIPDAEPLENAGLNGVFDPADKAVWEDHGRRLLRVMLDHTHMLPCAEDLGTIPPCSFKILKEFCVPGIDVQRWNKHWDTSCEFKAGSEYRKHSMTVISTHDMSSLRGWWEFEAGGVDGPRFERLCGSLGIPFEAVKDELFDGAKSKHGKLRWKDTVDSVDALLGIIGKSESEAYSIVKDYKGSFGEKQKFWTYLGLEGAFEEKSTRPFLRAALAKAHETASVFSVQYITDWFSLSPSFREDAWSFRVNFPGTVAETNWAVVMPWSLEEMLEMDVNGEIREMNVKGKRG